MRDDGISAPSGPDELFRQYYGYVRRIVANTPAIPAQDAEDVAMEIMTRFVERDVVGMFDPDMKFRHDGQEIQARFRTFLTAQVALYVKGQRDKLGRQRKHETPVIDTPGEDGGPSLLDLFGGAEDDLSALDAAEWIRQARAFLATVPKRSDRDRCDLVRLFDTMIDQVGRTGEVSTAETAARLGVSPAVTGRWVTWLRENLRQQAALSRRVKIGGETYTLAHVRQATGLIKAVKGQPHFPAQALFKAGSPLAGIDYHKIARLERAAHPECELPAGDHHKPAPHVLAAVVRHLDRVAPVPAA